MDPHKIKYHFMLILSFRLVPLTAPTALSLSRTEGLLRSFPDEKLVLISENVSETKGFLYSKALPKDLTYESVIAYLRSINKVAKSPAQHVAGLVTCAFFLNLTFYNVVVSKIRQCVRSDH